ncbi:NIPSNAP family protein [Kribbella sandramycini]|uniref:NIPSNAP family protein n=1 Tax=Kribbella sandramycini TaxID=60450 RepID=A0A7Y4L3W6_9ACTN|nr:quinol monooxygenase YgiN [Kribbella sandramycini]NOL42972.1 NIPSNAP family protein [Kribbella sandramycini]
MNECCTVVDLRQYTLHSGQRDTLIDLFDEHFVEGQEVCGMHVAGQFRDLDDPDRFVWLRGFRSLDARAAALQSFYTGPIWRQYAEAANATMIDSDNALLLEPVYLGAGYPRPDAPRTPGPTSLVAGIVHPRTSVDDGYVEYFRHDLAPQLTALGAPPIAVFQSVVVPNNFPALPLRDDIVLAWLARFPDEVTYDAVWSALGEWPGQHLRLRPTDRSQLR